MAVRKHATKPEGPTGDFEGDITVSDKPPSRADLERVADFPILDANRKAHKFKSLYQDKPKVLIIFIRHFFCGVRSSLFKAKGHRRARRLSRVITE